MSTRVCRGVGVRDRTAITTLIIIILYKYATTTWSAPWQHCDPILRRPPSPSLPIGPRGGPSRATLSPVTRCVPFCARTRPVRTTTVFETTVLSRAIAIDVVIPAAIVVYAIVRARRPFRTTALWARAFAFRAYVPPRPR